MVDISPVSPKYINFITNLEYEFCTTQITPEWTKELV